MTLHYVPIASDVATRFRTTGQDDAGADVRRMTVHRVPGGGAYPCRHCLDLVADGDDVLLGAFKLVRPLGYYGSSSPIFVHADGCPRYEPTDEMPWFIRERPVSVRAYDADDQMVYDVSDVAVGNDVEPLVERCLADGRTRYANIHTARFGCFLCRVEAG